MARPAIPCWAQWWMLHLFGVGVGLRMSVDLVWFWLVGLVYYWGKGRGDTPL